MKGHGLFQCYFPWTAQRYYNQILVLALTKSLSTLRTHVDITKTCPYNFDPLKPHFYIVNLGFTGVYIIFLISAQKHRLWYPLEPPRRGGSNEYSQSLLS